MYVVILDGSSLLLTCEQNFLFDPEGHIKLSDFGLACVPHPYGAVTYLLMTLHNIKN